MATRTRSWWAATWIAAAVLTTLSHEAAATTIAYIVWTPGPDRVGSSAIHLMDAETGDTRVLVEFELATGLDASADGRRLVCASGFGMDNRLTLVDARTGAVEYLPREDDIGVAGAAKFSPDGAALLYMYAKPAGAQYALKTIDLRTRVSTWLTKRGFGAAWPDWSPDGAQIVFVKRDPRLPSYDLHIMPAEGGPARNLTFWFEQDDEPAWSPDGSEIAFVRVNQGQGTRLATYDIDTGDVRELTEGTSWAFRPSWSPDGQRIVFYGATVEGINRGRDTWNLYTIGRDGTDMRRLTHHEPDVDVYPVWVDTDLLAVSRGGKAIATWGRLKLRAGEERAADENLR